MTKREEVLEFGLTFPEAYVDTPFHDENWVLLRYRKNKKAFAWTYEREGHIWVNVKADPEWRDFWRKAYPSVLPGYHQNKTHWNSIILDGSIPEREIKRMIGESYDLIAGAVSKPLRLLPMCMDSRGGQRICLPKQGIWSKVIIASGKSFLPCCWL